MSKNRGILNEYKEARKIMLLLMDMGMDTERVHNTMAFISGCMKAQEEQKKEHLDIK